jgi:hypothetical protein
MTWKDKYKEEADKAFDIADNLHRCGDNSSAEKYIRIAQTYEALAEEWEKKLENAKNDIRT